MKYLFIVGAPRSGTTWLQLLLAQHPNVATTSETHIYTQYINLLQNRWQHELGREQSGHKVNGLTQVISESTFHEAVGAFAKVVFGSAFTNKSNPELIIEKTPEHALHADLILNNFPDAYFLNIVRDPRAVANSFVNAANSWWTWTESGPIGIASRWNSSIDAGRHIAEITDRYLRVSYEQLSLSGATELKKIFNWLEMEVDEEFCAAALEACSIDNLKSGGSKDMVKPWQVQNEPKGFFRAGALESWRTELSPSYISVIENLAASNMDLLGYKSEARSHSTKTNLITNIYKLGHRIAQALFSAGDSLRWHGEKWMNRF